MRFSELIKKYFDDSYSPHVKGFYLGVLIQVIMLSLLCIQAVIFRYGIMPVFWIIMGVIVVISAAYFAGVTGHYTVCSCVVLFVTNLLIFPVIYLVGDRPMGSVVIFFVPAVLLCVVMLKEPFMYFASALSVLIFSLVIYYQCAVSNVLLFDQTEVLAMYAEIGYATVVCGILSGICIQLSIRFYSAERIKADNAKLEAVEADNAKNVFLSNVSHEMRTPMNAILGTSHVLMNSDISGRSQAALENVANACNALLITVEDLLDFSFQVDEKFYIENGEYNIYGMLDDVINMTTVNVVGKGFDFLVDVDPDIPDTLLGDMKHIRQMLTYLLTDAAHRTIEGRILLRVQLHDISGDRVRLGFFVEDTGEMIPEEERIGILEYDPSQDQSEDATRSRTFLALSFCKRIVDIMNGDIDFDSTENKTVISFFIEQQISDISKDAGDSPDVKDVRVLVYEKSRECSDMIMNALQQCCVDAEFVASADEFRQHFVQDRYTHVFIATDHYEYLKNIIRANMGKTNVVILSNLDDDGDYGIIGKLMLRPAFYTNVNAAIRGKEHFSLRNVSMKSSFTCPGVRVMAVDDNLTNLHVVSSLLSKYQMEVITASGGRECLNRLERQQVDIIFLDYMMPEMDGVDTLKNIRAMDKEWVKNVPVIALTANAVSGVKQMLLKEGFNDYITKPLSVDKLEKCLLRYLSRTDILPADND